MLSHFNCILSLNFHFSKCDAWKNSFIIAYTCQFVLSLYFVLWKHSQLLHILSYFSGLHSGLHSSIRYIILYLPFSTILSSPILSYPIPSHPILICTFSSALPEQWSMGCVCSSANIIAHISHILVWNDFFSVLNKLAYIQQCPVSSFVSW